MYNSEYLNIFEQYKKVRESMVPPKKGGMISDEPALSDSPTGVEPTVAPSATPDTMPISIETGVELSPGSDMGVGGDYESLKGQILSKLESAVNLTKQEIDNVRATLDKAKFDESVGGIDQPSF